MLDESVGGVRVEIDKMDCFVLYGSWAMRSFRRGV